MIDAHTPLRQRGTCYKLAWKERFTPAEGAPVDTDKSWTWDGDTPEDYDAEDIETWPMSPEYEIPIPETNGTTTVVDIVAACTGCSS